MFFVCVYVCLYVCMYVCPGKSVCENCKTSEHISYIIRKLSARRQTKNYLRFSYLICGRQTGEKRVSLVFIYIFQDFVYYYIFEKIVLIIRYARVVEWESTTFCFDRYRDRFPLRAVFFYFQTPDGVD